MRSNNVECSTDAGPYCTTHEIKVPFYMPEFSSRKIISYHFQVDKNKGESDIVYDMIIGRGLMVQLFLTADFKHELLQLDGVTVPMKEPIGILGKTYLTSREMHQVVMQTAETVSKIEDNERLVKILNNNYEKSDL